VRLDVIYAIHVNVGDLIVGEVHPDAPTRPVQPMAAGMTVRDISENRDERPYRFQFHWGSGLSSAWYKSSDLVMVVR
jgi:hypothetical protein